MRKLSISLIMAGGLLFSCGAGLNIYAAFSSYGLVGKCTAGACEASKRAIASKLRLIDYGRAAMVGGVVLTVAGIVLFRRAENKGYEANTKHKLVH